MGQNSFLYSRENECSCTNSEVHGVGSNLVMMNLEYCVLPRENNGTQKETRGSGWDMRISLKLFLEVV